MEKNYKVLITGFLILIAVGLLGFYRSYFSLFPNFDGVHFLIHLHTFAFLLWFALVIIQPILIRKKNFALHRKLGRFSYYLVGFIFVSVFLVSGLWFRQELPKTEMSTKDFYAERFPGLFQGVLFTLY